MTKTNSTTPTTAQSLGALRLGKSSRMKDEAEIAGGHGLHPPLDALLPALLDRALKEEL